MVANSQRRRSEDEERAIVEQQRFLDEVFSLLDHTKIRTVDLFATLDTDQSGTIDRRELHNTLAQMGLDVNKEQTESLFSMLDVDRSGDITIAEFLQRMRKLQLERRAAAKADARRKATEAQKLGEAEAKRAAATRARLDGYEKLGRVDERLRSAKADQALMRIVQHIIENKLKMVDVFNRMDADDSGFIDKTELQTTMHELGLELSLEEAAEVCSDLDVDGDGTVERAEFFKRYQVLHRERRKAEWSLQRRMKDCHSFQTIAHNPNLQLDSTSKRAWQWQPTKFRVPSLKSVANPAPVLADLETLASAIEEGSMNSRWPIQPTLRRTSTTCHRVVAARPSSAPATTRRSRPFSASSRPGSAARTKDSSVDPRDRKTAQLRPSTGTTKVATSITGHLELLKPQPVSLSASANAAAEKAWKQNYIDTLLSILDQHKLNLADLFSQIDTDGSGAIDHEELRLLLMLMGVNVSDREKLHVLFSLLDVDGDGEIDLHEFLQRMREIQQDRAVAKAGVSRRVPIVQKHPMMQRKGENYREYQAKRDQLQTNSTGTESDRCGSPRPASASARMQTIAPPPPRPLSATVRKARKKNAEAAAAAAAATVSAVRLPLADKHPNDPITFATTVPRSDSIKGPRQSPCGKGKRKGTRLPLAPHRHTEQLAAIAHSRRVAERKASAGRIAIFAGVSIETAEKALHRSKDDATVATQIIMRNKLGRNSGMMLAAAHGSNGDDGKHASSAENSTQQHSTGDPSIPPSAWRSTTAHRDQQRHQSAAAVAAATRTSKEQRSGAWVPVGYHVDILEKQSISNDRKQLSC